jgi:hypothetical protein
MNKDKTNHTTKKPKHLKQIKPYSVVRRFDAALLESTHVLADGIFRPLNTAKRSSFHIKKEVIYCVGKEEKGFIKVGIEWRGIQLDVKDQQVFLAIVRLISEKDRRILATDEEADPLRAIVENVMLGKKQEGSSIGVAPTSLYEVCKLAGLAKSGANFKAVQDSIKRLMCTVCWISEIKDGKPYRETEKSFRLIADYEMLNGQLYVGISPLLTNAILGNLPHAIIDMPSMRQVRGDVAKRLHMWLSTWASYDKNSDILIDTLVGHVWGDTGPTNEELWQRRHKVKKALTQIAKLEGWTVELIDSVNNKYRISKPKYVA